MSSRINRSERSRESSSGSQPEWGTASHELKQSLNVISLALANLRHYVENEITLQDLSKISKKIDTIERNVEKISHLADLIQFKN